MFEGVSAKFMAGTLDVTWNIIGRRFCSVVYLHAKAECVCAHILFFLLSTRDDVWAGEWKKTQTVQSTLHGGLCVGRFFVLNLSRQHKKVHGLFRRDIFFSSLSTRFCSGDWLDWRRMEILQSTKVLELVTVFFALNIYCLVWRIRETNKWIIQFASWTIEWKFVFSAIVSVNLAVIIS